MAKCEANSYLTTATICAECEMVLRCEKCAKCGGDILEAPFSIWCIDGKHYHEYCYHPKKI